MKYADYQSKRYGEISLTFEHLYDEKWGVIVVNPLPYQNSIIIMPEPGSFVPEDGKQYKCTVQETCGVFKYNGIDYTLAHATLTSSATVIDLIDYRFSAQPGKVKINKIPAVLSKINGNLKPAHTIIMAEVQTDHKTGAMTLKPQYLKEDPVCNGKSMRFLHLSDPSDRKKLEKVGQKIRCREDKVIPGIIRSDGVRYVNTYVSII